MDQLLPWGIGLAILYWVGIQAVQRYDRLRQLGISLGCLAFLTVTSFLFLLPSWQSTTGESFLVAALAGALAGLCVAWGSWIVLPAVAFLYSYTLGPVFGLLGSIWRSWGQASARRRAERQNTRLLRQQASNQRQTEMSQLATEVVRQVCVRSRQEAQFTCQLLYDQHARELEPVFPRTKLQEYFQTYFAESVPVPQVETHAAHLQNMIQQHLQKLGISKTPRSLTQLQAWYDEQREQIETLADVALKNRLLVQLRTRFAELSSETLEQTYQ